MPDDHTDSDQAAPRDQAAPSDGETVSWRSLHEDAIRQLSEAGLGTVAIDARRIIEEAAGFAPGEFVLGLTQPATTRSVVYLDKMLARRITGEPLQYVLGSWGFRELDLRVDRRALIPRPETEVVTGLGLAELERQAADHKVLRAIDLGTGTGAIGLSLLRERTDVQVALTDVSADALNLARANLIGLGRAATRGTILEGAWFGALDPADAPAFNLVISNPPYVRDDDELPADVRDWEPGLALFAGADGLDAARVLIDESRHWLVPGGALVLELGETQLEEAADMASRHGYDRVEIHQDLAGRNRGLVAQIEAS